MGIGKKVWVKYGRLLWSIAIASTLLVPAIALAEQYDVNAVVPYDVPDQAATIKNPNKATVYEAQQTITGTCKASVPATIISVWRKGSLLGSASCLGGIYNVPVILSEGQNVLIVRTANGNGKYGPDSHNLILILQLPVTTTPLPTGVNLPTSPTQRTTATNAGSASGLSVTTTEPFGSLSNTNDVSVRVTVNGGQQPYTLHIQWGDGSTEDHALDQAGEYSFAHTYLQKKSYEVYVKVRDVLGAYTEYAYAVVSLQPTSTGSSTVSETGGGSLSTTPWRFAGLTWYYWLLIILLLLFVLTSYMIGYLRAEKRFEKKKSRKHGTAKKKREAKKR